MSSMQLTAANAVARSQRTGVALTTPLRPVLVGPAASLRRYTVAAEKQPSSPYTNTAQLVIPFPGLLAGEVPDTVHARVYLENAELNYFNKYVGISGSCMTSATYTNRVRLANFVLVTNATASRNAAFGDRDVKVGDAVTISAVVGSSTVTMNSTVSGFVGEPVAATIGASTAGPGNAGTQSASSTATQVSGTPINEVVVTANGGSYNSISDGYLTRTYTVSVTQSSTAGNATTGRLSVVSADGGDNVPNVVPAAFGSPTTIGTKGLTATFSLNPAHGGSPSPGSSATDFLIGQQWTITVAQAFTPPTATSGGTYTGTITDSLIVTVVTGGALGTAVVTAATGMGGDHSGPTTVPSGGVTPVGSFGVTETFTGTLRAGDIYIIPITAATTGAIQTITLANDIPTNLRGIEVNLSLFLTQTGIQLPATRSLPSLANNWTITSTAVTLPAGLVLTDPSLTNGGVLVPTPVTTANVFVSYKAWKPVPTTTSAVFTVSTPNQALAAVGTSDPLNPLGWAATRALMNTSGQLGTSSNFGTGTTTDRVKLVIVGDPSVEANWTAAYEALVDDPEVYAIVPLTTDPVAIAAGVAHVNQQSTPAAGFPRVIFVQATVNSPVAIVGPPVAPAAPATATIAQYPGTSPAQYTLVSFTGADLIATGVTAGDVLRINYRTNALGQTIYDTYVIETVISSGSLQLLAGPTAAISTAVQAQIWRTPTTDAVVNQVIAQAAAYGSSNVLVSWPDSAGFGGATFEGFHVGAAVAGLAGSVPSQQGLRNVGLMGIDSVPRSNGFLAAGQLDRMAAGGVFVVSSDSTGAVYVRVPNTTNVASVQTREEMVTRNTDALLAGVQDAWSQFTGPGNVTPSIGRLLDTALQNFVASVVSAPVVTALGPAVTSITMSTATPVTGSPDLLATTLTITGPSPLNGVQVTTTINLA